MDRTIKITNFPTIGVFTEDEHFDVNIELVSASDGLYKYRFSISATEAKIPKVITLRWRLPSFNIKGVWKPGGVHDKRQQYDWELDHIKSRISVDAPVICVFGHANNNIHTIACSDAINLLEMNAVLREEDNYEYYHISFFTERTSAITTYTCDILIDCRDIRFSESIQNVSKWWESFENLKPCAIPSLASAPLYSSWYQFHQDLEPDVLLAECKIAYNLGYELMILDDGWQTMDNNRGYDYTGDWQPERFPNMAEFVQQVKSTGMKFGLWYSVPFCGNKSKAYKRFKDKFLTENHRWAPVLDPRYPEVREYLIGIYVTALKEWKLDAFKLDFIDDFKVYPETVLNKDNGRDYANVNEAVYRLLSDMMIKLKDINPDIGIEFRQQYVGPALRKFGNMFRAFDCPNDVVSNRIRTTDVKLLSGNTPVHSDPQTWHLHEQVELAALQVLNGIFAVPQMSMRLEELSSEHLSMVKFYTSYWKQNKDILLFGEFTPFNPLSNYPILKSSSGARTIIALYEDYVPHISIDSQLDIINAKMSTHVIVRNQLMNDCEVTIFDCKGQLISQEQKHFEIGVIEFQVPASGLLKIKNNNKT